MTLMLIRRRFRVRVVGVAVATTVSVQACASTVHRRLTQEIKTVYCQPHEDDLEGRSDRYTRELAAEGDAAAEALLKLARSAGQFRDCALTYLARLKEPRAVPILRSLVRSPSIPDSDRGRYVTYLGWYRDRDSLDLVLGLMRTGNPDLVRSGVGFLGALDDARAARELRALATTPEWFCKGPMIEALGNQRDPLAVPLLGECIERGPRETYRFVLVALACIRTREALDRAAALVARMPEQARASALHEVELRLVGQRDRATDPAERAEIDRVIEMFRALAVKR